MALEFTLGRMAGCMKDFIRKTKSMVMAFTLGQISKSMLAGGTMESNMELEFLFQKKERRSMEFGKKE